MYVYMYIYMHVRTLLVYIRRNKFHQNLCLWCTFSVSQSLVIWKTSLELNPLIQNNDEQDYLFPLYLPSY